MSIMEAIIYFIYIYKCPCKSSLFACRVAKEGVKGVLGHKEAHAFRHLTSDRLTPRTPGSPVAASVNKYTAACLHTREL